MEFDKMLTLSTAHLTETTRNLLEKESEENNMCLTVYDKATYGWFIYVAPNLLENNNNIPADLKRCIDLAHHYDCTILCLDCDAEPIDQLPQYD